MLSDELKEIVRRIAEDRCEGQTLEVKSAHDGCPKLYDTLSAFSNQNDGGLIVFGLDESKGFKPVGVYDVQDLLHKATEQCAQMEPEVRAAFSSCEWDGKAFVGMEIPSVAAHMRPVFYKGAGKWRGSYVRVGESDKPMSEYEIYAFDAYRKQIRDDIRVTDVSPDALDRDAVSRYLSEVRRGKPNAQRMSDDELLSLLGLMKDGRPTLTAVLCFSEYLQAAYPQLCVTAVRVPGTEMGETSADGTRFIANKRIEGTLPQMIEGAVDFVAVNMRESIAFENGRRIDRTEYPLTAVREAVINALVHRDYSPYTEGMPVRIEMYRDRIEIANPGGMYGAIDIDALGRVHADTRNKTLISVLETLKVVENRYSGIPTIRRELAENGLPVPRFTDRRGLFKVTFFSVPEQKEDTDIARRLAEFCEQPRSRDEIGEFVGKNKYYVMRAIVEPLIAQGILAYTIPGKPSSRRQRVYTVHGAR